MAFVSEIGCCKAKFQVIIRQFEYYITIPSASEFVYDAYLPLLQTVR